MSTYFGQPASPIRRTAGTRQQRVTLTVVDRLVSDCGALCWRAVVEFANAASYVASWLIFVVSAPTPNHRCTLPSLSRASWLLHSVFCLCPWITSCSIASGFHLPTQWIEGCFKVIPFCCFSTGLGAYYLV